MGGSGVDVTDLLEHVEQRKVDTPYGGVIAEVGGLDGEEIAFLRRHGAGHTIPPHRVNYRANVSAVEILGCERIVATAAVGSINPDLDMGTFVVVDNFLDYTKGRESTFHDGGDDGVVHVDVTSPYCSEIRSVLLAEGESRGLPVHDGGVYVCTEGPRFESAAEIHAFRLLGGDLVGMTGVPEIVLARELGLCYATVASVTNLAAGLRPEPLSHEEVLEAQAENAQGLRELLGATLRAVPAERGCGCGSRPEPVGE
jgi:5'-methylthioadenosine phosphorylase